MKHKATLTTCTGRELELTPMTTSAAISLITLLENPAAQHAMVPLEGEEDPGPQKRRRHFQEYVRVCEIEGVAVHPPMWVGIRATFLEPGTIWEVTPDVLGTGFPTAACLIRCDAVDGEHVLASIVSPGAVGTKWANSAMPVETFAEIVDPVSAERLLDFGVELAPGDRLGRYPTSEEMEARFS